MPKIEDRYHGKTWVNWAALLILGFLSTMWLILGVLLLTGTLGQAKGKPAGPAGPVMTIAGLASIPVLMLNLFGIVARGAPLIRLYREGVELRLIGRSTLDEIPLIPGMLRLLWKLVTLQGFRVECVRIKWDHLYSVQVDGLPMLKSLNIEGEIEDEMGGHGEANERRIWFGQDQFRQPLERIAENLTLTQRGELNWRRQPSWKV